MIAAERCQSASTDEGARIMNAYSKESRLARPLQLAMLVAMGCVGVAVAAAASASIDDSGDDRVSVKVGYGDLNLATRQGKDILKRRIRHAADVVCGEPDARELVMSAEYRNCITNATNRAWSQVRWPSG
jgi:UrcA family protein